MFTQFSELPVELRLKIFRCCSKQDLGNIALVSKQCRDEVHPCLWESVRLWWHRLETLNDVEKYKSNLQHTQQLAFADIRCEGRRSDEEEEYRKFAFCRLLEFCDSEKLQGLIILSFICVSGLQLASEMLPAVTYLKLDGLKAVDGSWGSIWNFRYLKRLVISCCNIKAKHFKNIGHLRTLECMYVRDCKGLEGSFLAHVNVILSGLRTFEFSDIGEVAGDDFGLLTNFENVETLRLRYTQVNDNFFVGLERLQHLDHLDIGYTDVTDLGLQAISRFGSLRELDLRNCDIGDDGLVHVDKLENLTSLVVAGCERVSDYGLFHISKLKKLRFLHIGPNLSITDEGLVHIMDLPSLVSLDLNGCHLLTDSSLEMVSTQLFSLESIDISCQLFTIDGLHHLLIMPWLNDVNYDTDEIHPEVLEHFYSRLYSRWR